mgnify:CR=1 FL=1
MKLSLSWIGEYVTLPADLDLKKLAYDLTMSTVEVEDVEYLARRFDKMVVGVINSVEPHPNADKLRVCKVDLGGDVKEITAGVRPEQILLADKDEEGALQGTVEVTELMGSTEHVHVTAPDGQFVLIIPVVDLEAKGALKAGDPIWFKFEKNATHLFDKVSGKNLI